LANAQNNRTVFHFPFSLFYFPELVMAEAGSFAERVKQQADIVRVIGEYVRLKKSGANFTGLCPFHQEKTPSFAVHPVKQIYHCFGCGAGGDVFKFVMEMDKSTFPEAIRTVAEKCGIAIPKPRERSPEERRENQQRSALVEMHRETAAFFARSLHDTLEGKVAAAYLEDRSLDREAMKRFGLGFAPSSGDALLRFLKQKYPEKLLDVSGLISRDQSGRAYDRFRRRIMFPIANESGKVIAFGGRAMGDDTPKYMNSPETPIYTKSSVLYHLDRAKEALRQNEFAVLVEGYMDAIAVARAGIANVVASCGTSLAEHQIKLLGRFTRRVIVNYDPDTAGQAATERSIALLLESEFDVRVLALPGKSDPDKFLKDQGVDAYRNLLTQSPPYLDYLITRARQMDRTTAAGKVAALNFLMPYVQRLPNRLLRSEWATRIASELRVDEPVLREAFRRAAAERRSEVKPNASLLGPAVKPAERQIIRMLVEADGFREKLARQIVSDALHRGLESERLLELLISKVGEQADPATLAAALEERERRLLFEILFEPVPEPTWDDAESCLSVLRNRRLEEELAALQKKIEAKPATDELRGLLTRRLELQKILASN
jgi:DNA primase